jgi:hypothetical protein
MDREGNYKEYLNYSISKETEKIWTEELISSKLNEYKETSDYRSLYVLLDIHNRYDLLDKIMEIKIRGSLINKIVVIELLTSFLCKNKNKINKFENFQNKLIDY